MIRLRLVNLEVLSKIQQKTISETRKNILAISEISNPKKTTFIKEINQNNTNTQHLEVHQKSLENKNELQTPNNVLLENSKNTSVVQRKSLTC